MVGIGKQVVFGFFIVFEKLTNAFSRSVTIGMWQFKLRRSKTNFENDQCAFKSQREAVWTQAENK